MQSISGSIQTVSSCYARSVDEKRAKWAIVCDIAQASLKELAVSIAFTAIALPFVATPAGAITLGIATFAVVVFNLFIRTVGGLCAYQLCRNEEQDLHALYRLGLTYCQYVAPLSFSILDTTTRDTLIHEAGHMAAASLLYRHAHPKIELSPLQGGSTSYLISHLTKLGQYLGRKSSGLIVSAAGPAAAILTSTLHIAVAHCIRKIEPTFSRYLLVTGVVSIAGHIFYAASALYQRYDLSGHDFAHLWMGGIHPVVSICAIVALPVIVKSALMLADYCFTHRKCN